MAAVGETHMVHNRLLANWLLRELAPPITALPQAAGKTACGHLLFAYSSKKKTLRESPFLLSCVKGRWGIVGGATLSCLPEKCLGAQWSMG